MKRKEFFEKYYKLEKQLEEDPQNEVLNAKYNSLKKFIKYYNEYPASMRIDELTMLYENNLCNIDGVAASVYINTSKADNSLRYIVNTRIGREKMFWLKIEGNSRYNITMFASIYYFGGKQHGILNPKFRDVFNAEKQLKKSLNEVGAKYDGSVGAAIFNLAYAEYTINPENRKEISFEQ